MRLDVTTMALLSHASHFLFREGPWCSSLAPDTKSSQHLVWCHVAVARVCYSVTAARRSDPASLHQSASIGWRCNSWPQVPPEFNWLSKNDNKGRGEVWLSIRTICTQLVPHNTVSKKPLKQIAINRASASCSEREKQQHQKGNKCENHQSNEIKRRPTNLSATPQKASRHRHGSQRHGH